jgi:hypothetical protein
MGENVKLGYSVSNINSNARLNGASGNHKNNGVFGSLYGTYTLPVQNADTFVTVGTLAGYQDTESKRLVSNGGIVSYAKSDSQDTSAGAFLQLGARMPVSANWDVVPKTSLTYLNTGMDGFTESHGGAAGVTINNAEFATLKTSQSVELTSKQGIEVTNSVKAYPSIELGLSQERVVGNRDITGTFSTNTNFSTTLQQNDNNFIDMGAGVNFTISDDATAFVSYQGGFNSEAFT